MPHPFTGKHYSSEDEDALSKRPKLARHVGIIASLWSFLEARLGDVLGGMLRGDRHIGSLMYSRIKSEPARLAILQAIAEDRLPSGLLKSFLEMKRRIGNTGDERDRVVHGLWAIPEGKRDSIVWLDPREHAMFWATVLGVARRGKRVTAADQGRVNEARRRADKGTYLYNEQDFLEIEKRIRERIKEIDSFLHKVWWLTDRRQSPPRSEKELRAYFAQNRLVGSG